MNKTVNANIGGFNFHLDEVAFDRFSNYLKSVRQSLQQTEGVEEIMQDIEARIAELLQERVQDSQRVVTLSDVEQIMQLMGRPEEYASGPADSKSDQAIPVDRKLFRDPDDKVLGGVCSGISAYFGIEPVWLRLAFALLFFGFGTGLLLYFILWLVIPKARSTADRLRMKGEPINVANIEKNILEELEEVRLRSKETARKGRDAAAPFLSRVTSGLVDVAQYVFSAIWKVILFFMMVVGLLVSIAIFGLIIGSLTGNLDAGFPQVVTAYLSEAKVILFVMAGAALAIGIPFLAVGLFGVRKLFGTRSIPAVKWTLLSLWVIGMVILVACTYRIVVESKEKAQIRVEVPLSTYVKNDLTVKAVPNEVFVNGNESEDDDVRIVDGKIFVDAAISLDIRPSSDTSFHLFKKVSSRGRNETEAKINAGSVGYDIVVSDASIELPMEFHINEGKKFRFQKVELSLAVPEGGVVHLNKDAGELLYDVSNTLNILDEDMGGRSWKMVQGELQCLDCDGSESRIY
jgi:phage shock protein PspC (stress-responsive transcriptional regulator)